MISKEIVDSIRPQLYSTALFTVGDEPLFDRDSYVLDGVAEFWWALIERVELLDSPSSIEARSFLYLLKQFMPELEITPDEEYCTDNAFIVKTDNWVYKVRSDVSGFELYPGYKTILAQRALKMIRFGINPNVKNPEQFLLQLFIAFDQSIPEILSIIREEEYRALSDHKEFEVCKTILKNILKPLPVAPTFSIYEGKTRCEMEIDGWTLSFCVSSSEIPEFTKTLFDEMMSIIRNPKEALQFGGKYSLE